MSQHSISVHRCRCNAAPAYTPGPAVLTCRTCGDEQPITEVERPRTTSASIRVGPGSAAGSPAASGRVTPNAWLAHCLERRGDHLEVFWNGGRVLDHPDMMFTEAGRVGVWTSAESATHFDHRRAEAP